MKRLLITALLGCFLGEALAQKVPKTANDTKNPTVQSGASAANIPASATLTPGALKPFNEVITAKAITTKGLFTLHFQDDRYLVEIADSLLGRDLLIVGRIAEAAADGRSADKMSGYAGDVISENVVRFEKGPKNRVFLKRLSYTIVAKDSTENGLYRNVLHNNVQPIIAAFEVKTHGDKSQVIDLTDWISGDNELLFFSQAVRGPLGLGPYQGDKSYIDKVLSFPANLEIKVVKTYVRGKESLTYALNSSIVLLPKAPMLTRKADDRVGYFSTGYTDFDARQGIVKNEFITRFRLEPKEEDKARYLRGELVEPKKPIIFYIDPSTPKKWVPYLIQGVNDWQTAFERAGFRNAIYARIAPTVKEDSTFSLDDARHNAIIYKPSEVANAMGPHVHDPRSGEIIEAHINWYHNIQELIRKWYTIQAGAVDPEARKPEISDELMGQLIRFVSSHEVGHTLGLAHNYGSSSTVPTDSLRSNSFLNKYGHTPSIMDYARFNYVAQPEDHISQANLFPRVGDYDKWAIEYGYRWWPEGDPHNNKTLLNDWIIEKLANKRLWFGNETDPDDPRKQNEDLSSDAMKAGSYGVKNLKRILPQLVDWTKTSGEDFDNAIGLYKELLMQFGRYMGHVTKYIGGIYRTPMTSDQPGPVVSYVPKNKQKEAVAFLNKELFATPVWLIDRKLNTRTGSGSIITISRQQDAVLTRLLAFPTLYKLLQWEGRDGAQAYTVSELLSSLGKGIFGELGNRKPVTIFRRNLQKSFIQKLLSLAGQPKTVTTAPGMPPGAQQPALDPELMLTDIPAIVRGQLAALKGSLKRRLNGGVNKETRLHFQQLLRMIDDGLQNPKYMI